MCLLILLWKGFGSTYLIQLFAKGYIIKTIKKTKNGFTDNQQFLTGLVVSISFWKNTNKIQKWGRYSRLVCINSKERGCFPQRSLSCENKKWVKSNFSNMKKLLVVTGGSKGIGKALIQKFSQEGFDVITCARNLEGLDALKLSLQEKSQAALHYMGADLSIKSEVVSFSKFIASFNRPVDVLVNNTGLFIPGQVHTEEEGVLEKMINTNLYSAYHLTRALIPAMMERQQGYIFNMCSTASITPYVNGGSYCISKFAMLGMSRVLREEMKAHGIKVTAVIPGATFTASWEGTDLPEERFMKAEDIAAAIYAAYALSPQAVMEELIIRPQLGDL